MSTPSPGGKPEYPNPRYAWYVVGVLVLAYTFSFIDRQILALLIGEVKADLQLSDTQMGLLGGLAFAIFYTFLGIPIGRMADKNNRRNIIIAGIVVWSAMTAVCGLAKNFWQLFLARMGVGAGEAALSPPAYSVISDYFPPHSLGKALSVYGMGIYIGSGMAFIVGGAVVGIVKASDAIILPVLGQIYPWQMAFFVVGLPGFLVALLMLTVKEPVRRGVVLNAQQKVDSIPFSEVLAFMKTRWKAFGAHFLGFAPLSLIGYGSTYWTPAFFERTYDGFQVAYYFGFAILIFGPLGIVAGGALADYWRRKGKDDCYLRVALLAALLLTPVNVATPLMPEAWMAVLLLAPGAFLGAMPFGVAPAAVQAITPNQMRAQMSAMYLFTVNLIGLGLGPTVIGWITDDVFGDPMLVRYSLVVTGAATGLWAIAVLSSGLKPYRRAVEAAKEWQDKDEASAPA